MLEVLAECIVFALDLEWKVKVPVWIDMPPCATPVPLPAYTMLKMNLYISNIYSLKFSMMSIFSTYLGFTDIFKNL